MLVLRENINGQLLHLWQRFLSFEGLNQTQKTFKVKQTIEVRVDLVEFYQTDFVDQLGIGTVVCRMNDINHVAMAKFVIVDKLF